MPDFLPQFMFYAVYSPINFFCSIGGFPYFFCHFINNNSEGNVNSDDDTDNGNDHDDNVIDYFYDCDGIDDDGDNIDDCYGDSIDDGDDAID